MLYNNEVIKLHLWNRNKRSIYYINVN